LPNNKEYAKCQPIYKTFKGWTEDITKIAKYADLPTTCKQYVSYIKKELGVPITYISVGNDRIRTIRCK
jgi:adenylosuccinate synthase